MSQLGTSGRKAVVTGGAGFIGSHLVDLLLEQGHEVTVIDNLVVGRQSNIARHADDERFRFLKADVADLDAILPVFRGVDWVFHLAALADIVPSIKRPLAYHRANVDGTTAVLEAARANGVGRFVYAASSSCYGIADVVPTPESAPIQPMYPYALTKYIGEQYVLHWSQVYGIPCVALRLFNVYGPRARTSGTYGAVFGVFLAQKLAGKPFTVVGDGTQTRDFTFVSDVAQRLRGRDREYRGRRGLQHRFGRNLRHKTLGGAPWGRDYPRAEETGRTGLHVRRHLEGHTQLGVGAHRFVRRGRACDAGPH